MSYVSDKCVIPIYLESSVKPKLKKVRDELTTDNVARDHRSKIQKVQKTKTLNENIEKVLEFDRECGQNGHKIGSRYSALVSLHYLCQFARRRPFDRLTKADLMTFLDDVRNRKFEDTRYRAATGNVETKLANSTMNLIRLRIKRFYQWLHGMKKGQYPEIVDWIVIRTIQGDREISPEDLPTQDEIKAIIECTENPRDRALISLLVESGVRCGEASTTLLRDISWNNNGFVLTVDKSRSKSKFGRRIPLCACSEDVKNYINNFHPFKNDGGCPLFVSYVGPKTGKTNLKVSSIEGIVRKAAKRAGVSDRIRIHPHIFRHARASQLAELGWNEPMLRQYFGWSKTSHMPATYIHMSQSAMHSRYYQMYGKTIPMGNRSSVLDKPTKCTGCGTQNPTGYRFCFRCNAPLNKEEQRLAKGRKDARNALNRIAMDPELSKKFALLMGEAYEKENTT
jgi:integrase